MISYNIYGATSWPRARQLGRSAFERGQMPARLAMELELYQPDIINFSESPAEEIVAEIAERLKMNHVRFASGKFPGTLLSRFEIESSQDTPSKDDSNEADLFTRHWGRGVIKLPDGNSLVVHSAHLMPGPNPGIRIREVSAMLESMATDMEAGHSMLLMGDLNHGPDSEEYKLWIDAGWVDTFVEVGEGEGATIRADQPQWRIDYVMACGPIAEQISESRPLFEGKFRLSTEDAEDFALSDHLPQLAVFEQ